MEQYTIKDLMERYNLKTRQSIYQWCDGLNLKLHKGERNRAYATPEQVEQLDQLKEHLDKGGTIASFTPVIDTEIDTSSNLVHQSVDSTVDTPDWLEMVGAIAGAISPPNPISHWDRLYLAAERGYILSTERGSGAHALRNPEGRNGLA
jgi:hypothetical protein